jgi:hypothetical protein
VFGAEGKEGWRSSEASGELASVLGLAGDIVAIYVLKQSELLLASEGQRIRILLSAVRKPLRGNAKLRHALDWVRKHEVRLFVALDPLGRTATEALPPNRRSSSSANNWPKNVSAMRTISVELRLCPPIRDTLCKHLICLAQLGGLEPPTSRSTASSHNVCLRPVTVAEREADSLLKRQVATRWRFPEIKSRSVRAALLFSPLLQHLIWLRGQDLNLRPSGYEPDGLSASFLFVRRRTQSCDEFIAAVPLLASPEHDARDDQHVRHFLDSRKLKYAYLIGSQGDLSASAGDNSDYARRRRR